MMSLSLAIAVSYASSQHHCTYLHLGFLSVFITFNKPDKILYHAYVQLLLTF